MQPNEQRDPEPDPRKPEKPDPRDERAKWLLFAIAVLLGLIVSRLLDRVPVLGEGQEARLAA